MDGTLYDQNSGINVKNSTYITIIHSIDDATTIYISCIEYRQP